MKSLINILLLLIFTFSGVNAQKVISANGGTATAAGTEVSWTIGEPVTATVSDGTTTLTQGFHQSKLIVTAITQNQVPDVTIKVYPNPTSDYITIQFTQLTNSPSYALFDLSGKLIVKKEMVSNIEKLNMTTFTAGSYLLKFNNKNSQALQTFKIIKK